MHGPERGRIGQPRPDERVEDEALATRDGGSECQHGEHTRESDGPRAHTRGIHERTLH